VNCLPSLLFTIPHNAIQTQPQANLVSFYATTQTALQSELVRTANDESRQTAKQDLTNYQHCRGIITCQSFQWYDHLR